MNETLNCINMDGLTVLSAGDPNWPNSANITIIPDSKGFSLIDVGCGKENCMEDLLTGLHHCGLVLEDLHTVLLSHAHPDHMGAIGWIMEKVQPEVMLHHLDVDAARDPTLLNDRFDIPLAKSCFSGRSEAEQFEDFDILTFFDDCSCKMSAVTNITEIQEETIIPIGTCRFEVLLTPGHSPGHICLFDREKRLLFSGDLVGKAPAWYTPSSGGLIGYLQSLNKMTALEAECIIPAHGPVIDSPQEAIGRIETKLKKRESILLDALQPSPKTFFELLNVLFPAEFLHFFPGCGILESHLQKMEADETIYRSDSLIHLK